MRSFGIFNRVKENGQSLIEVALALPLMLIIFAGTVEAGNLLIAQNRVSTATRAATGFGVTHLNADELPSDWASAMTQAAINSVHNTPQADASMWNFAVVRAETNDAGDGFENWEQEDILGGEEDFLPTEAELQAQVLEQLQADGHDASDLELLVTVTHARYTSLIRLEQFFASYPETLTSVNIGIVHRQNAQHDNDNDGDGGDDGGDGGDDGGDGDDDGGGDGSWNLECLSWGPGTFDHTTVFLGAVDLYNGFTDIDWGDEHIPVTVQRIGGTTPTYTYEVEYHGTEDGWELKFDEAELGEDMREETDVIKLVLNPAQVDLDDEGSVFQLEVQTKAATPNSGWVPVLPGLEVGATTGVDNLGFKTSITAITEEDYGLVVTLDVSSEEQRRALSHVSFRLTEQECVEWTEPPDELDGELDGRYSDFLPTPTPTAAP